MCGRFAFHPLAAFLQRVPEHLWESFVKGDVIVPDMDILTYQSNGFKVAKWNFKPEWADPDFKATTHNARSETIHEKATFRDAWEKGRRCVIPANYFFEWQHGTKQGFTVHPVDQDLLYFAGLWEENKYGLRTTIITKASGDSVRHIHRRMPVMLKRSELPKWLKGNLLMARDVLSDANDENLDVRPYKQAKKQSSLF